MTDFHDAKDGQKYRARLRKQREYQRKYRERLIGEGAPERADIAAACLQAFLLVAIVDPKQMGPLPRAMLDVLEKRGFSRSASLDSVNKMARRTHRHVQKLKGGAT